MRTPCQRGHARLVTVLAAILALVFVATAAVATGTTSPAPTASGAGSYGVIHREGDLVVMDAKGAGASAPAAARDGYARYADARLLDRYTVRLVASPKIQAARPHVEQALADLVGATGQRVDLVDGYVDHPGPQAGVIDVVVSADSPCGGSWLGCATPVVRNRHLFSARVWLNPRLLAKPVGVIDNTVRHELGHALGLGHFDGRHEGEIQVMHSTRFDAARYRAGDIAGFRALMDAGVARGAGVGDAASAASAASAAPPPAPPPTTTTTTTTPNPTTTTVAPAPAVPASVDPTGSVDVVRASDVGIVVRGSARDPQTTAPINVVISLDGTTFEMVAGRQDQAGSHGFEVVWPAAPGEHQVCVLARNVGAGQDVELGCRQVTVSSNNLSRVGIRSL